MLVRGSELGVEALGRTLVSQHQSHGEEAVFAAWFSLDCRVRMLEPVDEQQGQQNDILGNLGRTQDGGHPFPETRGWDGVRHEWL